MIPLMTKCPVLKATSGSNLLPIDQRQYKTANTCSHHSIIHHSILFSISWDVLWLMPRAYSDSFQKLIVSSQNDLHSIQQIVIYDELRVLAWLVLIKCHRSLVPLTRAIPLTKITIIKSYNTEKKIGKNQKITKQKYWDCRKIDVDFRKSKNQNVVHIIIAGSVKNKFYRPRQANALWLPCFRLLVT